MLEEQRTLPRSERCPGHRRLWEVIVGKVWVCKRLNGNKTTLNIGGEHTLRITPDVFILESWLAANCLHLMTALATPLMFLRSNTY